MDPAKNTQPPIIDLSHRDQVREQIKALKVGERLRVVNGDYVLTIGVPSNDDDEADKVPPTGKSWLD